MGTIVDVKLFRNTEARTISLCPTDLSHEETEIINAVFQAISLIYSEAPLMNKLGGDLHSELH